MVEFLTKNLHLIVGGLVLLAGIRYAIFYRHRRSGFPDLDAVRVVFDKRCKTAKFINPSRFGSERRFARIVVTDSELWVRPAVPLLMAPQIGSSPIDRDHRVSGTDVESTRTERGTVLLKFPVESENRELEIDIENPDPLIATLHNKPLHTGRPTADR